MSYDIVLAGPAYSSWSMRIWLLLDRFGIDHRIRWVDFAAKTPVPDQIGLPPARTVPVLIVDGVPVSESLAITEELSTRHPDRTVWPKDAAMRAMARGLTAEMHASFAALRSEHPMNLRQAYTDVAPSQAVRGELSRLAEIWEHALDRSGGEWLCGDWSAADAFYAPVAARIAGYDLSVSDPARKYVARHLADPGFRRWRALGLVLGPDLRRYHRDLPGIPWPGPDIQAASPAEGPSINPTCPMTGEPARYFLGVNNEVWGFGTRNWRDIVMADPQVWPAFDAMRADYG